MEMKVTYSEDRKSAFFDGYKFRRDAKTGYYLANKVTYNGKRERLHVYVWRYFNGPVPEGYHVHHKDENKDHNDLENLACIPKFDHSSLHGKEYAELHHEEVIKKLKEKAIPKASEWHKSETEREWHRKQWIVSIGSQKPIEHICQYCGKKYMAIEKRTNRFCSNNCKSAARKKSGVDDETRKCEVCGKEFIANKYSTKRFCSSGCRIEFRKDRINKTSGERAGLQYGS